MAEQTLGAPLAGNEVIEAILDKLRAKMKTDCYLNPNSAYDWFTATVSIKLDMHDAGAHVKTDHSVEVVNGKMPLDGDIEQVEGELEIDAAAPDVLRVETGQEVPTLTTDTDGRKIIKGVRYSRNAAKKAGIVAMLLMFAGVVSAQQPERLTNTEVVALKSIQEHDNRVKDEEQEVAKALQMVEADIARQHPGYHFEEKSGTLVKDVAPKVEPKK